MSEEPYRDEYEKLFVTFCGRVERLLVRGIALALALLFAMQALLQIPAVRNLLTRVDALEGVPYRHGAEVASAAGGQAKQPRPLERK
ncbi:hypothetical protein [Gordoniibacillus kamchatkensis]|uniref:hypothetical protein n=1 Tax=Gordoniibacillus kamchatkensis TaxID=1590651 RepID=UPI000697A498|nr:hypothetical protein [Paenibacillus sp. VKM B-2647]